MTRQQRQRAATFPHREGEEGFMLLAVIVMCALVLVALSVAAVAVAKDLRRDKEIESQHRAEEYVRAIQLYYRKTNGYPGSIKALENSNNVRYLRQQWVDPLTGKADWRLIHQGQQKTTIKSFFGKELAGLAAGGLGSAAGMQSGGSASNAGAAGGTGVVVNGSSITINAGGLGGGFDGAVIGGASGSTGATGGTGSTSAFGDGTGGIIVGVGTAATGGSVTEPNGQSSYETWEFWYDPRIELLRAKVNLLGGSIGSQSAAGFGTDATANTGSTGPLGSGFGTSVGGGSYPATGSTGSGFGR